MPCLSVYVYAMGSTCMGFNPTSLALSKVSEQIDPDNCDVLPYRINQLVHVLVGLISRLNMTVAYTGTNYQHNLLTCMCLHRSSLPQHRFQLP